MLEEKLRLIQQFEKEEQLLEFGKTNQPLFSCVCKEPEGDVERKVYQTEITKELLEKLWAKQQEHNYKNLMGVPIATFEEFVNFFVYLDDEDKVTPRGLLFVIDDLVGLFWISDIHYPGYCQGHYTFFDGRHKGRIELVKSCLGYLFETWSFECVYIQVGLFAPGPNEFVKQIGFKKEGRLRNRYKFGSQYWDVNMYSILRSEVNRWRLPQSH